MAGKDTISLDFKIRSCSPKSLVLNNPGPPFAYIKEPVQELEVELEFEVTQVSGIHIIGSNVDLVVVGYNDHKDKSYIFIDNKRKDRSSEELKQEDYKFTQRIVLKMTNPDFEKNPIPLQIKTVLIKVVKPDPYKRKDADKTWHRRAIEGLTLTPINTLPGKSGSKKSLSVPKVPSPESDNDLRRALEESKKPAETVAKSTRTSKEIPNIVSFSKSKEAKGKAIKTESKPKKSASKKVFTNIGEDGWCTPWAETLDIVNIFFVGIKEEEKQNKARELARRLGAGITENIKEATHIVTEPDFDKEILVDMVNEGQKVVNVKWIFRCWDKKEYAKEITRRRIKIDDD